MTTPEPTNGATTAAPAMGDAHSVHSETTASTEDHFADAPSRAGSTPFGTPGPDRTSFPKFVAESRPETPRPGDTAEHTAGAEETPAKQDTASDHTPPGGQGTASAEERTLRPEEDDKERISRDTTPVATADRLSSKDASSIRSRRSNVAGATKEKPSPIESDEAEDQRQRSKEVDHTVDETEEEETPREENEDNYLYGVRLYLLTLGLFFATFVIALDNTIIATAIPKITSEFDSINDVGWYGSAYLLTTTSLQPSFGKIFSYFNIKWTYILALAIFEVGSIVCATAPNSTALIVGRAVAGLGAAGLFSGGITIIGYTVPLRRRALYIALLSSTFGIASIVGPILGGIFTDSARLTWRFCFWINLPVGGIAILTTGLFFGSPKRPNLGLSWYEKLKRMDLLGAFLLICAITCLLLALQWGGTTYPWSDSRVWGTILGFGLIISAFIALELYIGEHATIPRRVLAKRGVAVGVTFMVFMSCSLFSHIYYLPFYFQAVKGVSAEQSGIRTIPYLVSNTIASIVVGASITVFGPYTPFLWVGSAIFTVGAGMLYRLQVDSSTATWIGFQLLAGIGAGASIQVPFISVQAILDAADMPTGNALTIFFNTLGGAISVSISENIFSNELIQTLDATVPPAIVDIVDTAGATGIHSAVPAQYLPAVLQAYDDAVTRAFLVPLAAGAVAFVVSLLMPWGSVKGKKVAMGAA